MRRLLFFSIMVLALTVLALTASAGVVTVSPSVPGAWSWMAANGGSCFFTSGGPALDAGAGFVSGTGGFFAKCTQFSDNIPASPSSVWLGTDQHAGQSLVDVKLSQIKTLTYSTFVPANYTFHDGANAATYPKEPIMLTLTFFKAAGDYANRRQLWFRPWLSHNTSQSQWPAVKGDWYNDGNHLGHWENWNCLDPNQGIWYEHYTGYWTGTWNDVLAKWPTAHLVPTSTTWDANDRMYGYKSVGFDANATTPPGAPTSTGTGKCLNFWVGARQSIAGIFSDPAYAWWGESYNFRGYVDDFTLGVDYNNNGVADAAETITYDFESDQAHPMTVSTTSAARYDKVAEDPRFKFRYRVFGTVLDTPAPTTDTFVIWDGSYVRLSWTDERGPHTALEPAQWLVKIPGHGLAPGQYVSVIGYAWQKFCQSPHMPAELYSNMGDLTIYN